MAKKIVIRSSKPAKLLIQHPYGKVESVTRFELYGSGIITEGITAVTVWREEADMEPCHLSNMDLEEAVAGKVDHMDCRAIARTLIELDRVTAVEAVNSSGNGVKITKD